jgi:hypothetical protein
VQHPGAALDEGGGGPAVDAIDQCRRRGDEQIAGS